jgi:hypothetical protein
MNLVAGLAMLEIEARKPNVCYHMKSNIVFDLVIFH